MPSEKSPRGAFDCKSCIETTDEATRAALHCGWMPEQEWAQPAQLPPAFGPNEYTADVCPGWLARQPAVTEAMEAYAALEKGALVVAFPDIDQATYEGAMTAVRAFNERAAERMKENK